LQPEKLEFGDTREIPESALENLRMEGRFDSSSQIDGLNRNRWKIRDKASQPPGEKLFALICVDKSGRGSSHSQR